jgi:hypothetical protein
VAVLDTNEGGRVRTFTVPPLGVGMRRSSTSNAQARCTVACSRHDRNSSLLSRSARETSGVEDIAPPDPPLANSRIALRQFRLSDASAISVAFDVVRVQLVTHLDNDASQRVAASCGFVREGVLRAWEPVKDDQPDLVMWSRLASDPPTRR